MLARYKRPTDRLLARLIHPVVGIALRRLERARPAPYLARTRAFYASRGFVPLEEFPLLWGEGNPCLQYVKALAPLPHKV